MPLQGTGRRFEPCPAHHQRSPQCPALLALAALSALLSSCDERPREKLALVDHTAWSWVEAADDPFSDRPENVDCPETEWYPEQVGEDASLAVDTTGCNYITVVQPTGWDIWAQDTVDLRLWHFNLSGAEAVAHAAVQLGDTLLWEVEEPIPSPADLLNASIVMDEGAPAETPLYFHLHNHGGNSWNFIEASTTPAGATD